MAIAKKPNSNQTDADTFISGAALKSSDKTKTKAAESDKRTPTVIRFPPDLLAKIDAAAKQRGVSRAAWILTVSTRALDNGDW
jgi:hypothetical protein